MLCQFTFQNFKSYKNETTLDYQAAVLPEFKNTLITETSAVAFRAKCKMFSRHLQKPILKTEKGRFKGL